MINIKNTVCLLLAVVGFTVNSNAQYFSEDFETGGSIPAGWINETNDDGNWLFETEEGYADFTQNYIHNDHTTGSGYFAAFYHLSEGEVAILTSPVIDLSSSTNSQLVFWRYRPFETVYPQILEFNVYANGQWNYNLIAGLGDLTSDWQEVIFDMSDYKYSDVKIQFKGVYNYRVMGIDDISIDEVSSCPKPINLFAATTATTADLSWLETGSADEWNIEWGDIGFSPSGTPTFSTTSNPYTITGLTESTEYDFYVQANCGSETSAWAGPFSFKTTCNVVAYPWEENFDSSEYPWDCITIIDNGDVDTWETYMEIIDDFSPHSGSMCVVGRDAFDDYLISPQLSLNTQSVLIWWELVGFDVDEQIPSNATYEVLISTTNSDIERFTTTLASFNNQTNITWNEQTVDLSSYAGQDVYLAFHVTNSTIWGLAIDDISVTGAVGVNDINNDNISIKVYPSPNNGIFNLEISTEDNTNITIEIINVQGQFVYKTISPNTTELHKTIDISGYAKGMYYIKVRTKDSFNLHKIVVQ